jgi:hypothetical protein
MIYNNYLLNLIPMLSRATTKPVCKSLRVVIPPQSMPKSTMVSATASEIPVTMVRALKLGGLDGFVKMVNNADVHNAHSASSRVRSASIY